MRAKEKPETNGKFASHADPFPVINVKTAGEHFHKDRMEKEIERVIPIIPIPFVPGETTPEVGQYFPSKLATGFGMAKIVLGMLEIALGVVALFVSAEFSGFAGGLWAGTIVAISGSLGIFAGRHSNKTSHILSFLFASMLCVAVTGLLVVFTATGLARDATAPTKIAVDSEGHRIPFLGEVNSRTPAILVNIVLLIIAIITCILAIFCCLICMKEACQCYSSFWDLSDPWNRGDSQTRKDRLVSWLEQQASEESESQNSHSPKQTTPRTLCGNKRDSESHSVESSDMGRRYVYKVSKKYSNTDSQASVSTLRTELTYDSSEDYLSSERRDVTSYDVHKPPRSSNKLQKKAEGRRFSQQSSTHYDGGCHHNYSIFPR